MRILLISNYAPSLLAFRGDLLRSLAERGHRVSAAVPGPLGDVPERLAAFGVGCHELPFERKSLSPVSQAALLWQLRALFQKTQPELLLLYTIKPVIYGALMAALDGKMRVACLIPGLGYLFGTSGGWKRRVLGTAARLAYRAALSRAERVFFQNPDDAGDFARWKLVQPAKSVVLPGSGVNLAHYRPEGAPQPRTFLLVARLLHEKGIAVFAEASRLVRRRHPDVQCRVLGPRDPGHDGIRDDELRAWVDEGLIDYLGEAKDVRPHMSRAAVVVLPSHYREGVPRVLLEAMAMGRAIITTDRPGCRETVREGRNGILVPAQDPQALADAMIRFIDDPGLAARMGQEGRCVCESEFDADLVTNRICAELGIPDQRAGGNLTQVASLPAPRGAASVV